MTPAASAVPAGILDIERRAPGEVRIAPSLLSSDWGHFADGASSCVHAGADWPRFSIPFDVHLMVERPFDLIEIFAAAGADLITVHAEATPHLQRTLAAIRALGRKAGVALNPATPLEALSYVLDDVDLVLVMTVNPGFGGQSFLESQLPKIAALRRMIERTGRDIALEVDGGVDVQTAPRAVAAGADVLVAGTAVFRGGPAAYAENIARLR